MIGATVVRILLLISAISQSSSLYTQRKNEEPLIEKKIGYRLPNNTAPRLYTLNLEPHIDDEEFTFDGTSSTLFEVLDSTWTVTLHTSSLIEIDKLYTTVINSNGIIETPISQRSSKDRQFFTLQFSPILELGNYTLKLKWRGYDASDLRGFYRAMDLNMYGERQYMVATHFEPVAARAAFPCWDEPAFKAEFEVSLIHPTKYRALSNMPTKTRISADDEKVWTTFHRSPVMSTYLVTFVLAPYASLVNEHGNMSFFVPPDKLKFITIVSEVSPKIVAALERYTGISYSLPKLDAVCVPQYSSSATEHWGLIAYSNAILVDPDISTHRQIITAMLLAAHELTHQWFGNLVTPAWWGDLWLSEAFAVYLGTKMIDNVIPDFHAMDLFTIESVNGLSFPADRWSRPRRPIRWVPDAPQEVLAMFSSVTYRKGAAIVRMLEHMVTEEAFCRSMRTYFNEHQFGSVVTDDLWQHLQEGYDKVKLDHLSIKEVMSPWVEQTGYPLLKVTRDHETGFINITQHDAMNHESGNLWTIPINYVTTSRLDFSSTRPMHLLRPVNESFVLKGIHEDDWIILNIQQTGFYRVDYDWENWRRIIAYLNSENYHKIHVLNRAQLLHDIAYFAETNDHYYELLMDLATYLRRETNFLPWTAMDKIFNRFAMPLMNTSSFDFFRSFMLHIMSNMIDHIGFEDRPFADDNLDYLARVELLPWACAFGHEGCNAAAPVKLMEILSGKMKRSARNEHHGWIYCTALAGANVTLWDLVMTAHWANPLEHRAFKYLGCTKDHQLIEKYFGLAFANNSTLLSDDVYDGLNSMIMGPAENYNFALDYFIVNIEQIQQYSIERNSLHVIWDLCQRFAELTKTQNQLEKLSKFLHKQTTVGKMRNVGELINIARSSMTNAEKLSAMFNSIIKKKP